jgi:peroxiredoxin
MFKSPKLRFAASTTDKVRRSVVLSIPALGALAFMARQGVSLAQTSPGLSPAAMEATAPPLPAVGTLLHLPDLVLLDGRAFSAAQTRNRITLVYWWSSTCPFCALQSPEIQKLWTTQQSRGWQMLALSVDKKPSDAVAYLRKKGYTFPSAWVSPEVHRAFPKPKGLPVTLVVGRDGKVLQAERGQMFAEDVELLTRWH